MANDIYGIAKQGFIANISVGSFTGQINWVEDNFSVALLDDTYVLDINNHVNRNDIQSSIILKANDEDLSVASLNTTAIGSGIDYGTGYAESVTLTNMRSDGTEVNSLVVYRDSGLDDPESDVLISYIETAENIPLILNGGDVTIDWDLGTGRVFRL